MTDFYTSMGQLLQILAVLAVAAVALAVVGLLLMHRRLRRIRVPANAGLATTLRSVPLGLVVILDLLDFGLDIFAAPIVWIILSRYRLEALRNTAALEALIPFTQVIPTLTVAWIAVRALNLGDATLARVIDAEQSAPGRYEPRIGRNR